MKIKRNVGVCEMDIELSYEELRKAHEEYDFINERQDMLDCASAEGITLPEDFPFEDALIEAEHFRSKNDYYMESYWDSIKMAMYEELEKYEDE